ncbi:uncharacterized protein LOC123010733 [Tribolium madens]|uniref:uncharacterized protein LOC123010733 n=1 Tax=Tribolium madens TaxID=41895 RepID=UPI001CF72799|nr:uncharacterized protein LOC123010733 [Tribolium madens]
MEALKSLTENSLKELIPTIGPRIKFLNKLKVFKTECFIQNDPITPETLTLSSVSSPIVTEHCSPSTSEPVLLIGNFEGTVNETCTVSKDTPSCSTTDEACLITGQEYYKQACSRSFAFLGEENLNRACRMSYDLDLQQFLNATNAGRFVLETYSKTKTLTTKTRNMLVNLIINSAMAEARNGKLTAEDFENLSNKICDLFKCEHTGTYYIPRCSGAGPSKKKPVNAKGKLVDKYRNLKRLYNITKDYKENLETDNELSNNPVTDDMDASAKWLKHWNEPFDTVLLHWDNSFYMRRNSTVKTVDQFLSEWPILKHQVATVLIDTDFKKMFPNAATKMYLKWELFYNKLLECPNINKPDEIIMAQLKNEKLSEDGKCAVQIAALPVLFPPKGRSRVKNSHWKPSILECQESIINHVKISGEIENFITERSHRFKALSRTIQPYMIVVGPTVSEVTESYLIIDAYIYKASTTLQCFDLLFKTFHVLCAEYPPEAEHIYLLIQKVIFGVSTQWDKQIPYVMTLANSLSL